jgi:hypothetical protein
MPRAPMQRGRQSTTSVDAVRRLSRDIGARERMVIGRMA